MATTRPAAIPVHDLPHRLAGGLRRCGRTLQDARPVQDFRENAMSPAARALLAVALLTSAWITVAEPSQAPPQDWVARSNANAQPLLQVMDQYVPSRLAARSTGNAD